MVWKEPRRASLGLMTGPHLEEKIATTSEVGGESNNPRGGLCFSKNEKGKGLSGEEEKRERILHTTPWREF